MTDEQHGPSKALANLSTGTAIAAIVPQTFDDVYRFAKVLALSGMTPYGMKTEQQVAVALFHGLELGLPPMQAIQSIAVIKGRPSLWGDAIMALIRRSGELEAFEESIEGEIPPSTVDLKDWPDTITAVCTMKRRGEKPVTRKYSVGNARRAKLWMKKSEQGGDSAWITNPERMLTVRARSFCSRDAFQDTLRGFQTVEEMQDAIEVEYREVKPAPASSAVQGEAPPAEPDVPREASQATTAQADEPEKTAFDWDRALQDLESDLAACADQDATHPVFEAWEAAIGQVPRWIMTKAQALVEQRLEAMQRQATKAKAEKMAAQGVDWTKALAALASNYIEPSNTAEALQSAFEGWQAAIGEDAPDDVMAKAQGLFDARLAEISVKAKRTRKPKAEPAPAEPEAPAGPPPNPYYDGPHEYKDGKQLKPGDEGHSMPASARGSSPTADDEAPPAENDEAPPAPGDDDQAPAADDAPPAEPPLDLSPDEVKARVDELVAAMRKSKTLETLQSHIEGALKLQSAKLLTGEQEDELREIIRARKRLLQGAK